MSRGAKLILAALVLIAAASAAFLLLRPEEPGRVARITLDGELIEEIDLDRETGTRTIHVNGNGGLYNTILVQQGHIRVLEANCLDQICVNQGFISDGTVPIVCLPNRLIIEITGGGDGLDAAAG